MAEERAMRESELEKVGSALSSVPTRASQTIAVGAAAVGFLTSSAVVGDLNWFSRLNHGWQSAVLWMGGTQIALVVIALVLTLSMAPPDTVGLYQGPPTTETVAEKRRWWRFWRRATTEEPPLPIGFADEARDKILATSGSRLVTQSQIDEYMAMIAFLRATEDSDLLHRRRRRVSIAAWFVAVSAVLGGAILCVAAANRLGTAAGEGNQVAPKDVILGKETPNANIRVVPSQASEGSRATPTQWGNTGGLQRQGLQPRWPGNSRRRIGRVDQGGSPHH